MSSLPFGEQLPLLRTAVPGPASRALVDVLAKHECPAITARRARRAEELGTADDDPFVGLRGRGANLEDADDNVFVDLTAGFAVSLLGHADPGVVAALHAQAERLLHASGDFWPDVARIRLLERLARVAPAGLEVALLGLSGSDAVDAAIKTARLATGRTGILVFEGGYHGLALGVLGTQAYAPAFTAPFVGSCPPLARTCGWACSMDEVRAALADGSIGLVIVEPLQGRGGMRAPPSGWLAELVNVAHSYGALVAFDEIQCGLGRTGAVWMGETEGAVPDLLCTGKALGGGLPLSACLGSRDLMSAWGSSVGEALHTQTFLGHPLACATALVVLDALQQHDLAGRCGRLGAHLRAGLEARGLPVVGRGLMLGAKLDVDVLATCRSLLRRGWVVLPAGRGSAAVLSLTPPVCLTDAQVEGFFDALDAALLEVRR